MVGYQLKRALAILLLSTSTAYGVEIIPHRAQGFGGVENSITAIRQCDHRGLDAEIDIRYTKDNVPVLMHDEFLKRTTGVEGKVSDYTTEQLTHMYLRNSNDTIPTLEQALQATSQHLILHIKEKSIRPTLVVVERMQKQEQAYFFLNQQTHYDEARELISQHHMHIIMRIVKEKDIAKLHDIPYEIAFVSKMYRPRMFDALHKEGKKTIAFAIPHFFANFQMRYFKKHQVSAIETDNPQQYRHIGGARVAGQSYDSQTNAR